MGDNDPVGTARMHMATGRLFNKETSEIDDIPVGGSRFHETTEKTIDDIPVAGRVNQEMSFIEELAEELEVTREDLTPLEGTGILELIHDAIVSEPETADEEETDLTDISDLPGSASTGPRMNWERQYLDEDDGEETDPDVPVAGRRLGE